MDCRHGDNGAASSDSDGTIVSWAWDFGDGATGSGVTPSHAYGAGGTYTVALRVTDDGGAIDEASQSVTVAFGSPPPPPDPEPDPLNSLLLGDCTSRPPSTAVPLDGAVISGDVCIFTTEIDVAAGSQRNVCFDLDGTAFSCEKYPPYDFNHGSSKVATPWDTLTVVPGAHEICATFKLSSGGQETACANFIIQ